MKVLHVSFSDSKGGAAIAAHRLLTAQRAAGLDAKMLVVHKLTGNLAVEAPLGWTAKRRIRITRFMAKRLGRMGAAEAPQVMRSLGLWSSGMGRAIAREMADLVHLHWIGSEMMSLSEVAKLPMPIVWTGHDMWPFCGAEHYSAGRRFADGYQAAARIDIDAIVFRRKMKLWRGWRPTLICPSNWLASEAAASPLMRRMPRVVIPNTLDMGVFKPGDKDEARRRFGLPADGRMVLFGAAAGTADPLKGFDLLKQAIGCLTPAASSKLFLATFGSSRSGRSQIDGLAAYEIGKIGNPDRLAALYSAADVFVAPSRMDNLPNTLLEAQACGLPCVAFDIGGMRDVIATPDHGVLVPPFDVKALAHEIVSVANNTRDVRRNTIRADAVKRFGSEKIVTQHVRLYQCLLGQAESR